MSEENGVVPDSAEGDVKGEQVNDKEENAQDGKEPLKGKDDQPESKEESVKDKVENGENDSSLTAATDLENKIIRQIEYYFGDINLPRDKYLLEQTKLDSGWVPLEKMLKFKRLASLSTDPEVIIAALNKSPNKLMEVSEDKTKLRRVPDRPVPEFNEARRSELMTRTVYAKGFPVTGITLDDLIPYFANFGSVENVQMRTYLDKATKKSIFKGSVFVIFKTKELAAEYLARESVKFGETELLRKWQADYFESKKQERKERDEKRKNQRNSANDDTKQNSASRLPELNLSKGTIIKLKGLSGDMTREDIKKELQDLEADVAFIEFNKGDSEGWVRLHGENTAQPILDKLKEKPLVVCGVEIETQLIEGEEEDELLTKTRKLLDKIRSNKSRRMARRGKGRGGKGRGGGGRDSPGDRKRKGSPCKEEPPAKVEALAAD